MWQREKRKTLILLQPYFMSNMVHFIIRFAARQLFLFFFLFVVKIWMRSRLKYLRLEKKNSLQKLRTWSEGGQNQTEMCSKHDYY